MTTPDWIDAGLSFGHLLMPLVVLVTTWFLSGRLKTIHGLVNSHMTEALATIARLQAELAALRAERRD